MPTDAYFVELSKLGIEEYRLSLTKVSGRAGAHVFSTGTEFGVTLSKSATSVSEL
jgi:hypothetical protein